MAPASPKRRMGFHVSIGGGFPAAISRALERGCSCLQVFCGNPRGWQMEGRPAEEVEAFRRARAEADLEPLFAHSCYLINPCSRDESVRRRSVRRLAEELELSAAIGADCYVLHPGSHKGRQASWGVQRAARSVVEVLGRVQAPPAVLLESMASPHGPGGELATLGELAGRVQDAAPGVCIGLAIDSCHVFAAGYDLRQAAEVDRLVNGIEKAMGLDRLRLLHVNDARDPCGSRRDRHEHIGQGQIGEDGFRNLLGHPALRRLPLILETPWESVDADRCNLAAVRRIAEEQQNQ